ncbi:MAG: exo-beta-1,3-glucanase [Bacteroidetes bacterium]|jgi:exo-beta-1,3-glucanase (GH17 family)|nr:exo-beta-1,3-glucanase [Bacteroidota bacterium]MBT6684999.1 exo-beta-1,3-glucanase [Bacteroidota bacterium]MBT7143077.1 exo-beta-1,3-glucanase [Bacteroidota bacterium]MBT7491510.1 exo-beta-1,3-glucanase [Bacteroidota bacterium]
MRTFTKAILLYFTIIFTNSCMNKQQKSIEIGAADILGNPDYPAISYGGYRQNTREIVPSVAELKEDMKILSAIGIKLIRTYNSQQFLQVSNLLEAISQLKNEDSDFEMFVMLGTWIECKGAWTENRNHSLGNLKNNNAEIQAAVKMANEYPDIVKIIAVGNEAMVKWAVQYFVQAKIILHWVEYLQNLKMNGNLPANIWITSSDNYESWGGRDKSYHTEDLSKLINAVDYVSLHTYPFHDSHYNPTFWMVPAEEEKLSTVEKIDAGMLRAKNYAISQFQTAADYISSINTEKTIHIGETGWASISSSLYGEGGSQAADEYKQALFYKHMRDWTLEAGMSCFYFEAFDEKWKDKADTLGSENHFGLIKLNGQAKYALWDLVDEGIFEGLTRNGISISKTYNGDETVFFSEILPPPSKAEIGDKSITTTNINRKPGETVSENTYVVLSESLIPDETNDMTFPCSELKLNSWEGTCDIELNSSRIIKITSGHGDWWGCAIELESDGIGEDMSKFVNGNLNFEIKGNTNSSFKLGFQTGIFAKGTQSNNYVIFSPESKYRIKENWASFSIPIAILEKGANLNDLTALLFFRGVENFDGKQIFVKNIYYSR